MATTTCPLLSCAADADSLCLPRGSRPSNSEQARHPYQTPCNAGFQGHCHPTGTLSARHFSVSKQARELGSHHVNCQQNELGESRCAYGGCYVCHRCGTVARGPTLGRPLLFGGLICLPCPSVSQTFVHLNSSFWLYFRINPDLRAFLSDLFHIFNGQVQVSYPR